MVIDFVAFMAKLLIALTILKLLEVQMVKKQGGEDTAVGQALAFLLG